MKLKFWGVMGSCPGANPELVDYGIATPCVELRAGGRNIVLDCGTGIVTLSKEFVKEAPLEIDMFLTHTHWDHIQGFPFFASLYDSRNTIHIYGERRKDYSLKNVLKDSVAAPYFPVEWKQFDANIKFTELESQQDINLGDKCIVKTLETYHPDKNLAYRVESEGKAVVYLTDFDHDNLDEDEVIKFISSADILIYDAHFTDAEYSLPKYRGWGHSTWQKGIELSEKANVRNLYLFHHAPHRSFQEMKDIENQISKIQMNVSTSVHIAREGLSIQL